MNSGNHVRRLSTTLKLTVGSHYNALGITPKATQSEVKSAYYKLSKVYHPDKNQGSTEAATKFRDITAAYEVLGNVRLRRLYDRGIDLNMDRRSNDDDDPALKFYRSREYKSRPPTGTGRTPYYDFDEWSKAHYGTTFARDKDRKEARRSMREERQQTSQQNKIELVVYLLLFCTVLGLTYNDQSHYDRNIYVKQASKEKSAPKATPPH